MRTSVLLAVGSGLLVAGNAWANAFPTASVVDGVGVNANYEELAHTDDSTGKTVAQKLHEAGASVVRVQFPSWGVDTGSEFYPNDTYQFFGFSAFISAVRACADAGLRVYAILGQGSPYCGSCSICDPPNSPDSDSCKTCESRMVNCYRSSAFRCHFNNFVYNTVKVFRDYADKNGLPADYFTWELWNEPDQSWALDPYQDFASSEISAAQQYMQLAMGDEDTEACNVALTTYNASALPPAFYNAGALEIFRTLDPSATIVAPAVATTWFRNYFLEQCLDDGLLNPGKIDGLSVHFYRDPYGHLNAQNIDDHFDPERVVDEYSENGADGYGNVEFWTPGGCWDGSVYKDCFISYSSVRHLMNSHGGANIPIISGEWGVTAPPGGDITNQFQADYLQRMMLTNFSVKIPSDNPDVLVPGVPISVWFEASDQPSYHNWHFGMLDEDGIPKPSFYGMKTLTSNLKDAYFHLRYDPYNIPDNYLMLFRTHTNGREILAAWTTDTTGPKVVRGDPWWGNLMLTNTPMYVGQPLTWHGNDGNWSATNWTYAGLPNDFYGWPNNYVNEQDNYQAVFTSDYTAPYSTINLSGDVYLGGLQFGVHWVKLAGGKIRLTPGGGNLYVANGYFDEITSELADAVDRNSNDLADVLKYTNTPETFVLRKSGGGEVGLNGYNTFHGSVLVGQGLLDLGTNQALGDPSNPVTLAGGGIDFNGFSPTMTAPFLVTSTGLPIGNWRSNTSSRYTFSNGTIADNAILTVGGGGTLELAGPLSGNGGLNKVDSGTLILNAPATSASHYGVTTISGGSLSFATANSLPSVSSESPKPRIQDIVINSGGALIAATEPVAAAIGTNAVMKWLDSNRIHQDSTGALALTSNANNAYSGTTNNITISSSYPGVYLGADVDVTYSSTLTPTANTYRLGGGNGTLTLTSVLKDVDSWTKRNLRVNGKVVLKSASTYRGTTTIEHGGTLTLTGSGSVNSASNPILIDGGALYVNSIGFSRLLDLENGGTLGGTGIITSSLNVNNGHLSPGASGVGSIGTLFARSTVSFNPTSSLDIDVGVTADSRDVLAMAGTNRNVTLNGTLNIYAVGPTVATGYRIITGASSVTGTFTLGDVPPGYGWSISVVPNGAYFDVVLNVA